MLFCWRAYYLRAPPSSSSRGFRIRNLVRSGQGYRRQVAAALAANDPIRFTPMLRLLGRRRPRCCSSLRRLLLGRSALASRLLRCCSNMVLSASASFAYSRGAASGAQVNTYSVKLNPSAEDFARFNCDGIWDGLRWCRIPIGRSDPGSWVSWRLMINVNFHIGHKDQLREFSHWS